MRKVNNKVSTKYDAQILLAMKACLWGVIFLVTWLPINYAGAADSIYAQHDRNSSQFNRNCTGCHGDVLISQSLNPAIPRAHVAMLPYAPGESNNDKCLFCHRSTELVVGLSQPDDPAKGSLRRPVDSALCALCHGPGGPGRTPAAKQFYQVDIGNIPAYDPSKSPDAGKALYETICSGCHKSLANSEVKGESASEIQEEINENEGGMGPLKVLTPAQIQAIANALASP